MKKSSKSLFAIRRVRKRRRAVSKKKTSVFAKPAAFGFTLKRIGMVALTVALTASAYFLTQGENGEWFKASILQTPAPFDGTVYPIQKVPNWAHANVDHSTRYEEIPDNMLIDLPPYDLSKLAFPSEDLIWGNPDHDIIRNIKITYPVPYASDYQMSQKEGTGSHPAVDIKVPEGTPIHAIANGVVIKAQEQNTGFGVHAVIQHKDVPNPDNPSQTTDLFSGYAHLSDLSVSAGQVVKKGDLIGWSGSTGTATAPHLHFQMDKSSAPWSLYWPFSSSEAWEAGMSFFEAVNAGLGLENLYAYTVNPMKYVAQYLDPSTVLVSQPSGGSQPDSGSGDSVDDPAASPSVEEGDEVVTFDPDLASPSVEPPQTAEDQNSDGSGQIDPSLLSFNIKALQTASLLNSSLTLTVEDAQGQTSQLASDDEIPVKMEGVGKVVSKKFLTKEDFKNGSTSIIVQSDEPGTGYLSVGKSTQQLTFVEKVLPVTYLGVEHDGYFIQGEPEEIKIIALDENRNPTPAVNFPGKIALTVKEGEALVEPTHLTVQNFKDGIATVSLTAQAPEAIKIRAQGGAIVGESERMFRQEAVAFSDVSKNHPNYRAIQHLVDAGVINGYPDGTFKPAQTVNRAEALKMLTLAMNVEVGPPKPLEFKDVDNTAWYAKPLSTAVEKGIVQGYPDGTFKPAQTVNKAEYAKMLFKTGDVELPEEIKANPYKDVPADTWFAPFAYLTNKQNLLDLTDHFYPEKGMSRGDVAEMIYRLLTLKQTGAVAYSPEIAI